MFKEMMDDDDDVLTRAKNPVVEDREPREIVDFVLVYESQKADHVNHRELFECAARKKGLELSYEKIGTKTFVKVFAPLDVLMQEAELVKLEMPLKGCAIMQPDNGIFSDLCEKFETDNEEDYVSAPFQQNRLHIFEGADTISDKFFRSSIRNFLVYNMLINTDICTPAETKAGILDRRRQGLLYLLMKKCYIDAFPLHDESAEDPYFSKLKEHSLEKFYRQVPKLNDDSRRELNHTWCTWWKFQPLWKIRNYFGEKIAFYFAWQGTLITCLWLPSIVGFLIFLYGLYLSVEKNCALSVVSNSTEAINGTDTSRCSALKIKNVAEDVLMILRDAFDNRVTPYFSLFICLWGVAFLEIWNRKSAELAYQWDVSSFDETEPDKPEFVGTTTFVDPITREEEKIYPLSQQMWKFLVSFLVVMSMILTVFVSVTLVILFKVILRVHERCPLKSDTVQDYDTVKCIFLITVIPTMLNACSVLFLGKCYNYVAIWLTKWENHRTQSDYNNALIIKLFAFQFANSYMSILYLAYVRPEEHGFQINGVFGMGPEYADTCVRSEGECMSLLPLQVLVLMTIKPFPKLMKDIAWPITKRILRKFRKRINKRTSKVGLPIPEGDDAKPMENYLEREYLKPTVDDFTLSEYNEKVIEFGFVMLFSACFPLAPLIALVINCFDMRVDAKRLLWFNRRPVSFVASDVGTWYPILKLINYLGVVSNAFIIAYTSQFINFVFDEKAATEHRLLLVLGFEHVVFTIMYIIKIIISDTPTRVKVAMRKERYQVTKILATGQLPGEYDLPSCSIPQPRSQPATTSTATTARMESAVHTRESTPSLPNSVNERRSKISTQFTSDKAELLNDEYV